MNAAGNLLLAVIGTWPAIFVVENAWPLRRYPGERLILDWFYRVYLWPGSVIVIVGSYWLGVAGIGPFAGGAEWTPLLGLGWVLILAAATAGERRERAKRLADGD